MQKHLKKKLKKSIKRLLEIEQMLEEWEESRKPILFIDEDKALLSSKTADIQFIKSELSKEK